MLRAELKSISSTRQDLRSFGVSMAVVLLVIAGLLWWKDKPYFLNYVYPAVVLGALGLLVPDWLRPLQRAWMALAVVLGFVMNRVILTILYYGMFTPAALICKILGKDLLHQRWDETAQTYWRKRVSPPYQRPSSEKMY